MIDYLHFIK